MKKILSLILVVLFPATFAFAADVTLEELQSQITELQNEVLKMSRRVDKNEVHRIKDKVDLGVELRTRVDSIKYNDVRALPDYANDMLGLWLRGYLADSSMDATNTWDQNILTPGGNVDGQDGWNDAFMNNYMADFSALLMPLFDPTSDLYNDFMTVLGTDSRYSAYATAMNTAMGSGDMDAAQQAAMGAFSLMFSDEVLTANELEVMKTMFKSVEPRKYDQNNSTLFTNKLRIRLNSYVNDNLSFTGRLAMYKVWGDATDVQWMDGTYKSMYLDGNAGSVPTDDKVHVERAYFVYKNEMGDGMLPWHFSFGRRPSTYGPGKENSENATLGGSPLSHIIQWQFDGASLQFDFENLLEFLPGSFIKICYGKGFESGWGSSNATSANNGLIATPEVDDVEFLGVIVKFFDNDDYKFWYNYARGIGVTDGFTGSAVMPFTVVGHDTDLAVDASGNRYDEYEIIPNYSGSSSRLEATAEVGDMEWHAFIVQGHTFGFDWFTSLAMSKSHPDGRSQSAMYQFMEQDTMLGSSDSKTGNSVWLGVATPEIPFTGGRFGFEYNQGSKYWVGMTAAEDDVVNSKLAVRGKVYEMYYHQPIVGDRLFATLGYQHFDYEYTGSGNYLGAPVKIEDANGLNTMMAVTDKVDKFYASFTYRY